MATIIKKWKQGRGDQPGVIQVKLRNLEDNRGVVLEVVDGEGRRKSQGSMLTIDPEGVEAVGSFFASGIKIDSTTNAVKVKKG